MEREAKVLLLWFANHGGFGPGLHVCRRRVVLGTHLSVIIYLSLGLLKMTELDD